MTFRHRLLSEWTETRWRGSAEAGLRDCAGQVECRRRPDRQGRGAEGATVRSKKCYRKKETTAEQQRATLHLVIVNPVGMIKYCQHQYRE
ncbi:MULTISPECIES: hypothetical protein [Photorhabdus]|uniref:Uncharacterized protein n=1 Tax=Photorhabdus khanii TaxID=1004150 RepID=A0A7C9GMG2_9GAMM|nr:MULTISPECIES: hypothetical protein [Photorhabdus]MQL50091.1 hypothetical protein [Photorhabdus khanii]